MQKPSRRQFIHLGLQASFAITLPQTLPFVTPAKGATIMAIAAIANLAANMASFSGDGGNAVGSQLTGIQISLNPAVFHNAHFAIADGSGSTPARSSMSKP